MPGHADDHGEGLRHLVGELPVGHARLLVELAVQVAHELPLDLADGVRHHHVVDLLPVVRLEPAGDEDRAGQLPAPLEVIQLPELGVLVDLGEVDRLSGVGAVEVRLHLDVAAVDLVGDPPGGPDEHREVQQVGGVPAGDALVVHVELAHPELEHEVVLVLEGLVDAGVQILALDEAHLAEGPVLSHHVGELGPEAVPVHRRGIAVVALGPAVHRVRVEVDDDRRDRQPQAERLGGGVADLPELGVLLDGNDVVVGAGGAQHHGKNEDRTHRCPGHRFLHVLSSDPLEVGPTSWNG